MDLISTLIKRPISLVLNSTASTSPTSTTGEQLRQKSKSPSPGLERRPTTPQNSLFASAMNTSINVSLMEPQQPTPASPSSTMQSCSTSSSSASTSNTIEELLIQINDNLNQASLENESAAAAELSPLSTKPVGGGIGGGGNNKLTPSSRSQATTPNTTPPSPSAAATAGADIFGVNSSLHQFRIDHELNDALFDEGHLHLSFNSNTGVNMASQKFVGLTEFDESSIPELPDNLNPDIEEQLNLTFEEGLIPTLTANINTGFNSTIKKADDEINNKIQLLAAAAAASSSDPDTAVSSDNEIFAECQSYHDMVNTTNDLAYAANVADLSEVEAYRSALNSYNTTTTNANDNALNATMENVADISADVLDENIFSFVAEGEAVKLEEDPLLQQHVADETFGDEPMEVDINLTQDLEYAANLTVEADHMFPKQTNIASDLKHNNSGSQLSAFENVSCSLTPIGSQHVAGVAQNVSDAKQKVSDAKEIVAGASKLIGSGSEPVERGSQHLNNSETQNVSIGSKDLDSVLQDVASDSQDPDSGLQHVNENPDVSRSVKKIDSGSLNVSSGSEDVGSILQHVAHSLSDVASGFQQVNELQYASSDSQNVASGSQLVASAEHPNLGALSNSSNHDRCTFSKLVTNEPPQFEMHQSRHELSLNKSIELPANCSRSYISDKSVIQDNNVDSATDALSELTHDAVAGAVEIVSYMVTSQTPTSPATIENDLADQISSTASTSTAAKVVVDAFPKEMTATFTKSLPLSSPHTAIDAKLNLTLDINTSFCSAKSSGSNSPTFPLKEVRSKDHFPHSPTARPKEKETFLEKSENAERINAAENIRKISITQKLQQQQAAEIKITPASPEKPAKEVDAPNATIEIVAADKRKRSISPVRQIVAVAVLNGTFDGSSSSAPAPTINVAENRLTFNVPSTTPSPTEFVNDTPIELPTTSNSNPTDADRRRTFNFSESTLNAQLNASIESMDIDESMLETLATTYPKSPPIPTVLKRQTEAKEQAEKVAAAAVEDDPQVPLPPSSISPPIHHPTLQKRTLEVFEVPPQAHSPPIPTLQRRRQDEKDVAVKLETFSPALPTLQKRPPIHPPPPPPCNDPFASPAAAEMLSAKEKTKSNARDEKDVVFVDKFQAPSPLANVFTSPSQIFACFGAPAASSASGERDAMQQQFSDADFQAGNNLIFNPSDFDYLLTKGNNNVRVDRSSLLLRFDPLLGLPVAVNQPQQQQQQLLQLLTNASSSSNCNNTAAAAFLSPTIEEDEQIQRSFVGEEATIAATNSAKSNKDTSAEVAEQLAQEQQQQQQVAKAEKNVRMSIEVIKDMNIENDCKKSFENSNSQSDEKQNNFKMDELEKKIKNEVLKTEDIEKKLKEAEQREEALIKRITEKDKTISKMNGVIEAYEKAIAELISEKEQHIQNYEHQLAEAKADRDSNYHHLTSLETTFSDLHVKYEKSKEMTSQLKSSEESLLAEKRQNLENLRLQEQRYEKMKNHAMQQLEIANRKLESLTKEHAIESTKLKALLKKEEISRASLNEQLSQKSRENAELVKICDELINGQGS